MIVKKEDYVLDVDVERTRGHYTCNSICSCPSCRNYYAAVKDRFHLLDEFFLELGVDIERPDELGCIGSDNKIQYLFAAYTVCGKIIEFDKYEIDLFEDSGVISIVISNLLDSDEQRADHFVITVYNITLPWVLTEPLSEGC